jgi:hypothetical protein
LFCQHSASESFGVQIFVGDESVLITEFPRRFVMKVFSLIGDVVVKFRNRFHRLFAAIATLFFTGERVLCDPELLLRFLKELRRLHELAIARNQKRFQAQVNANGRIGGRYDFDIREFQMKNSVPFTGFAANRYGSDAGICGEFAMPFDFDGADVLQGNLAVFQSTSIGVGEARRIKTPNAFKARVSRLLALLETGKEVLECGIETAKGMLTGRKVRFREIFAPDAEFGEFGRLLAILYRLPRFFKRGLAPLKSVVVQTAMNLKRALKRIPLFAVRVKTVCKRLVHSLAFLRFDVMSDRLLGCRANRTSIIRPTPQRGESAFQRRKFIAQNATRKPFKLGDNLGNTPRRVVFDKKMNVVWHDFKRMNCQPDFCGFLMQKLGKTALNIANQYLAAILRTPDYV